MLIIITIVLWSIVVRLQVTIDCTVLAASMTDVLEQLFQWVPHSRRLSVAIADSAPRESVLAPVAGQQAASSSSSQAIVLLLPQAVVDRIPYFLGELFARRAQDAAVRFQDFPYMDYDAVDALVDKGVVVVFTDEFGDSRLSLNLDRLRHCSNMIVTSPQQALRTQLPGQPMKMPKLYHMIRLREQGWIPGDPTEAFAV